MDNKPVILPIKATFEWVEDAGNSTLVTQQIFEFEAEEGTDMIIALMQHMNPALVKEARKNLVKEATKLPPIIT